MVGFVTLLVMVGVVIGLTRTLLWVMAGAPTRAERNVKYTQYKMPDLRISDDAPDWYQAKAANHLYEFEEKPRMEANQREAARDRNTKEAIARAERRAEHNAQMQAHYFNQIAEAKIKRWIEGNPVTRENPLKPHETPPQPYYYL